jgi:hypothetical protein
MSNLHRIETTGGQALQDAAPAALEASRSALAVLQSVSVTHPAVSAALEAVAGSLGVVHRLSQSVGSYRPVTSGSVAPPAPAFTATAVLQHPNPVPTPVPTIPNSAPPPAATAAPIPTIPTTAPPPAIPQTTQASVASGFAPTMVAAVMPATVKQPSLVVAPQGASASFSPSSTLPSQGTAPRATPANAEPFTFGAGPTQPEAGALLPAGSVTVDAALGAHSLTNFYKGLSGNDVVDSGGIFVATYQIPPLGALLMLRISLPGGYEFQAQAVVRWVQDPAACFEGTSPGFGAQFTSISQEGRQLVYRYVRNREPLFHDDF